MKTVKKTTQTTLKEKKDFLENINPKIKYAISFVMIALPLFFFLNSYIFDNAVPFGEDSMANTGETNLYVEWQKANNEEVLWNPNVFGGLPVYPRLAPKIIQVDIILGFLSNFIHWSFIYFFAGGIGLFLFLNYKKLPWYISLILAIIFVIMPDWQSLLGAGHNTKVRSIMIIPFFLLSFNYLFDKRNLLGAGFFILMFSWLVRTQHYQIVFYGIMLAFVVFIYPFIKMFIAKQYKEILKLSGLFVVSIILTVLISAQPFFSAREYADFSTRGNQALSINEDKSQMKEKGVGLDYATGWSLAPAELIDIIIARFHGGYHSEIYDGEKYPQLKGQAVPGYWGDKPFNGNYSFLGGLLLLLAIIGAVKYRKEPFIISLVAFILISTLLAFGKHFVEFYKLFYLYVPYFAKFRIPSMILNISLPAMLILAGYGMKYLINDYTKEDNKFIYGVFGTGLGLAIVIYLMKNSFAYHIPVDLSRYDANTMDMIKEIRKEFLSADVIRLILLLIGASGFVVLYTLKKLSGKILALGLFVLIFIEVATVTSMAKEKINVINFDELKAQVFKENDITKYLSTQEKNARAIALGNEFTSNNYAFFYPIISGYSAIKLQTIQDVIEHNLFNAETPDRINWNIINMLNGKYIIANGQIENDFVEIMAVDQVKKEVLHLNNNALPKIWFAKSIKHFDTKEELVLFMNKKEFRPDSVALVVKNENIKNQFSAQGDLKIEKLTPNRIEISTNSNDEQFLILSEIYYPKGWKALVNGKEIEIIQTNHLLRGLTIPAGKNKIDFVFEPETYAKSIVVSWIGCIIVLLMLGFGYYSERKNKKLNI